MNLKTRLNLFLEKIQGFLKNFLQACRFKEGGFLEENGSGNLYWAKSLALEASPKNTFLLDKALENGVETPELWRLKGESLMHQGQFFEANNCFDRALRLSPKDAVALDSKGYCLYKLGYYEIALSCFIQALTLRPRDPEILTNTGICLCHLGRYMEALNYFEKALQNGGCSPTLWNNKGFCLAKLGRYQEAYQAYKIALECGGDESVDLLCNVAAALVGIGAYREALYYFDRALQMDSEDPLLLNNVAVCLEEQGRYDLALKCYEKALSYVSDNLTYLYNKGVCLARMKCWEEALHCLEEVVAREPNHTAAWGELGAIYLAQGKSEKALICYNRALGLIK